MNRSSFSQIKYVNRLFFFPKAGYVIGVGFKILKRTPVPKLPESPHNHREIKGYINSKNSI